MLNLFRRIVFNLWYFRDPPWDTGISPPELISHLDNHRPGRALDLGCGTGTNIITMARRGWEAVGVDFAGTAIAAAQRKARRAGVNVELYVDDVTHLMDVNGSFDLVLDIGCFHSLPEEKRPDYIANLSKLVASGGTYLLYSFTLDENKGVRGISEAEIQQMKSHLKLVERVDGSERGRRASAWFTFFAPGSE